MKMVRELSPDELDRHGSPHPGDINEVDPLTGDTPLHAAIRGESLKELDHLIRQGANLNAVDEDGLTPLMCACSWGGVMGMKIAIRLINAGADVNFVRVDDEMTALCFAACDSRPEVVQSLLDRGAQVEGPPGAEQTPLMHAARENNVEATSTVLADCHGPLAALPSGSPNRRGRN